MSLFNKNPNETAYVGGKKHWTDVIKNSGPGELQGISYRSTSCWT